MVVRSVFGNFHDLAPDLQIAIGISGILKRNRNSRITPDVFVFYSALRRIDAHECPVVIHPHGGNLRASILHQRSEISERRLVQQIRVSFWNHLLHFGLLINSSETHLRNSLPRDQWCTGQFLHFFRRPTAGHFAKDQSFRLHVDHRRISNDGIHTCQSG